MPLHSTIQQRPGCHPGPPLGLHAGARYGIERALQQDQQDVGLGDYPVRGGRGWRHYLTLVLMAMLFGWEERQLDQQTLPAFGHVV